MDLSRFHDQHLHSRHSFDCKTPPEDNVHAAIARGLGGLTFTEHFDPHPEEWRECIYDHRAYSESIRRLREEFGDRLFIGLGVEVGYYRERREFTLDFIGTGRFDMVILSLHALDARLLHHKESWRGLSVAEGSRRYFEHLREAVEFVRETHARYGTVFHVLGHLDLVKRYSHRFFGEQAVEAHAEMIEQILQTCLEAQLVPEINTSSWRQGLSEPMPGASTLTTYARLGGASISLGSDAHRAEDIGAGFAEGAKLAADAGISHVAIFRSATRAEVPLRCV